MVKAERWRRIRTLLEQALERAPAERGAFLDSAAADDPGLRDELESLLELAERPEGFLEAGAILRREESAADAGSDPLLGRQLGPYRIEARLGAGGMGSVYLAHDSRLERKVALKFLDPALNADPRWRSRFLREARLASSLDHPNICTIHDVGEAAGRAYIAMQHIDGPTLKERIGGRPLPLDEVLSLALQVAEALAAAHERGIVHRDVKPGNVVVTPRGQAKVLDFGIARRFEESPPAEDADLTAAGLVLGTPASMSPEQASGGATDPRSDIFSLGVVMYEMATGVRPFAGASREEIVGAVRTSPHRPAAEIHPQVPAFLSAVIDRALAKEPALRYPSMPALIADLRRAAAEIGITSGALAPAAARESASRWRSPGAISAIIAIVVALALGTGAFVVARRVGPAEVPPPIRSLAVLPFAPLVPGSSDEALELGMADTLISRLGGLPEIRVRPITAVSRYARSDIDPVLAGREQRVDAVLAGHLQQAGNTLRVTVRLVRVADGAALWAEQFDVPRTGLFAVQDSIAERIVSALELRLSGDQRTRITRDPTADPEAYRLYVLGRFHLNRWTDDGLRKGLDYFEQAVRLDRGFALAHAGVARAYNSLASFNAVAPKEAFPRSRLAAAEAVRLDDGLAEARLALAEVAFLHDWDWATADGEYRRALELDSGSASAHQSYAYFLSMQRRSDEALREMERARELDPLSLPAITGVGEILYWARRFGEAEAEYRKALDMDPNFGFGYWALGKSLTEREMYEPAIVAFEKSIALSGDSPDEPAEMGRAHALAGRRREALVIAEDLVRKSQQRYVSPAVIASIYAALGDLDEAFGWLDRALAERDFLLAGLQVEPIFDPLRADPRFARLLGRMNFPPEPATRP